MKRCFLLLSLLLLIVGKGAAQESFEEYRSRLQQEFSSFKDSIHQNYEQFRKEINENYSKMLKEIWEEKAPEQAIPQPEEQPLPPVVMPEQERSKPIKRQQLPIKEVIPPITPKPQPLPIAPIKPIQASTYASFSFTFMGTDMQVRLEKQMSAARLERAVKQGIPDCWSEMSAGELDILLSDCLGLRERYALCDWAYLSMLRTLSAAYFGSQTDGALMLTAWLYCQSGYQMRLASQPGGRLVLLYASHHIIYGRPYWELDGTKYYALDFDGTQLFISPASFPEEKPLSLYINQTQHFAVSESATRTLKSTRYPEMEFSVAVNMNAIAFYDTYPTSALQGDESTRWAMYANTPIDELTAQTLYPALKAKLSGKSKAEAVECLLNFVQTAFPYEYDDKVWGYDRAFFAEESLYYPCCDCEDRSILFSRLVRDLLQLDVVLIYYPNHLATAVHYPEQVKGDYVMVDGKEYIVCDPTYIGARAGQTMPGMNNATCKVILLQH